MSLGSSTFAPKHRSVVSVSPSSSAQYADKLLLGIVSLLVHAYAVRTDEIGTIYCRWEFPTQPSNLLLWHIKALICHGFSPLLYAWGLLFFIDNAYNESANADKGIRMALTAPKSTPRAVPRPGPSAVPTPEQVPEPPRKSGTKKYVLISLIVLLLVGSALGAWLFFKPAPNANKVVRAEVKPPVFIVIEPFTVNLAPGEAGDQYLQIGITLQVADQAQADRVKLYMPQVRSRLLMLLSSRNASQLSNSEGKQKLTQDVIEQTKLPFTAKGEPQLVTDAFFTSFVIQ